MIGSFRINAFLTISSSWKVYKKNVEIPFLRLHQALQVPFSEKDSDLRVSRLKRVPNGQDTSTVPIGSKNRDE